MGLWVLPWAGGEHITLGRPTDMHRYARRSQVSDKNAPLVRGMELEWTESSLLDGVLRSRRALKAVGDDTGGDFPTGAVLIVSFKQIFTRKMP